MTIEAQELLAQWVSDRSEPAFRELVRRYFDLVYSTAVRLVDGDTHRAEDVAQIVFCDLAGKAAKLSGQAMLGGWLHRHTCFVARTVMRGERRRRARERQAVEMNALNETGESVLARVAPILDEAINELGADDRDAILLRFFERRNLRSVGEALGMTENAAQKRVMRALQGLGVSLQRRGVVLSGAALASGLAVGAVRAAPGGLALSVAGGVLAGLGGTGVMGPTGVKLALMAKLKLVIAGALVMAALITLFLWQHPRRVAAGIQNPSSGRQLDQAAEAGATGPEPGSPYTPPPSPASLAAEAPPQRAVRPDGGDAGFSASKETSKEPGAGLAPPTVAAVKVPGSTVRLFPRSGSSVTIKGTSNIHDWQVEGSTIGGFVEVGSRSFPLEPGFSFRPGPVWTRAEISVPVRSLRSVDRDHKPYSDKMDEVMYQSLRSEQDPEIRYRVAELSLIGTTNSEHRVQFAFQSRGELAIAGVTNQITMPIFVLPLGGLQLNISGRAALKMSLFRVKPPAPENSSGRIKPGDEVTISFNWLVGPRETSDRQTDAKTAGPASPPAAEEVIPAGAIKFINLDLAQVLAVYAGLTQANLDIEEDIGSLPVLIRFTNTEPVTRAQAIALLDQVLLEQAGIVVTHPESTRAILRLRR